MEVSGLVNCALVRAAREDHGWKLRLWNGFIGFQKMAGGLQMRSSTPISSGKR